MLIYANIIYEIKCDQNYCVIKWLMLMIGDDSSSVLYIGLCELYNPTVHVTQMRMSFVSSPVLFFILLYHFVMLSYSFHHCFIRLAHHGSKSFVFSKAAVAIC